MKTKNNSKLKRRIFYDILIFIFVVGMILSAFYVFKVKHEDEKAIKEYDNLVVESKVSKTSKKKKKIVKDEELSFLDPYLFRNINYDRLKSINSDFDSWLYFPGTSFDYPVVRERYVGSYFYNMKSFYGRYNGSGTPLIPKSDDGKDFRTLILGHRMINYYGSKDYVFSNLPKRWGYKQGGINNRYFYTYEKNRTIKWKLWAAISTTGSDMIYQTPYKEGSEDYDRLLKHCENIARYTIGQRPDSYTPTLMLSTCSRRSDDINAGRFALVLVPDMIYDKQKVEVIYYDDIWNENLWTEQQNAL